MRKTSSGIGERPPRELKTLNALHITRAKKNHKKEPSLRRPSRAPGLSQPVARPSPPPFSARVARPPGGGQGGWGSPSGPPTDSHPPAPFPLSRAHPRHTNHPQPQHSALILPPMPQFHQSCVRASCVRPAIKTHRSIPSHPYSTPKQPPCPPFTPLSPTQNPPPSAL